MAFKYPRARSANVTSGKPPPHPATVAQRKPPHPATIAQPSSAPLPRAKPPHPATVVQRRQPHPATVAPRKAVAQRMLQEDDPPPKGNNDPPKEIILDLDFDPSKLVEVKPDAVVWAEEVGHLDLLEGLLGAFQKAGLAFFDAEEVLRDFGKPALQKLLAKLAKVEGDARKLTPDRKESIDLTNKILLGSKSLLDGGGIFGTGKASYFKVKLSDKNTQFYMPMAYFYASLMEYVGQLGALRSDLSKSDLLIAAGTFLANVFSEYGLTLPNVGSPGKHIILMLTPALQQTCIHEAIHLNASDKLREDLGGALNEGLTEWLTRLVCEECKIPVVEFYREEVLVVEALVKIGVRPTTLKDALFKGDNDALKRIHEDLKIILEKDYTTFLKAARARDLRTMLGFFYNLA